MNGRYIPGFYFDTEKGKYFRVQAGGGHKYSRENVAKSIEKQRAQEAEALQTRKQRKQTVIRPHRNKLLFQLSQREIGDRRKCFYTQNTWPAAAVSGYSPEILHVANYTSYFDYDPGHRDLFLASLDVNVEWSRAWPPGAPRTFKGTMETTITRTTSPISSLNYMPASGALVITTLGADRPPVIHLTDPAKDGPFVGEQFTPRHCATVWTSAPRITQSESTNTVPSTDTEIIAVGASKDLKIFSRTPEGGTWNYETALSTESDVLATTWLSSTTACIGCRDGTIRIYDTRAQGSSQTLLRHPAPINQIRRADDFTRLVVSGLCDTLLLYDMRMAQTIDRTRKASKRRNRYPFTKMSSSITRFKYANKDTMNLGLDVNTTLGLVAAADEDNRLNVYNLYTGKSIKQFSDEGIGSKRVKCVRFVEDVDGDVSLLANWRGNVTKFGWC